MPIIINKNLNFYDLNLKDQLNININKNILSNKLTIKYNILLYNHYITFSNLQKNNLVKDIYCENRSNVII